MIETDWEKGSRRMSETHYSSSEPRFMSARTYYRRTADEQNAGERKSWKKAIHYSSDSSQLSYSFPPVFLDVSSLFLSYFPFLLPLLLFCPFFILLSYHPLSSFSLIGVFQVSATLSGHTHTHRYACVRQSLGILSMQPWYRCLTATQTANVTEQTHTVEHPGRVRTFH